MNDKLLALADKLDRYFATGGPDCDPVAELRALATNPSEGAEPAGDVCHCPQHGSWIAAADVKRLVREIDVALNGEGAAKQASLCDIAAQICSEPMRSRLAQPQRLDPSDWCALQGCIHKAHGSPTWKEGQNPFAQPPRQGRAVATVIGTPEETHPHAAGDTDIDWHISWERLPVGTKLYTEQPASAAVAERDVFIAWAMSVYANDETGTVIRKMAERAWDNDGAALIGKAEVLAWRDGYRLAAAPAITRSAAVALSEVERKAVEGMLHNLDHECDDVEDEAPSIDVDEDHYWAYHTYHALKKLFAAAPDRSEVP